MKSAKSPTGIYCANDITAIGMLTTVEISKTDMGHFALQLLIDRPKAGTRESQELSSSSSSSREIAAHWQRTANGANITFNIRTICHLFMYPCPYIQFLYSISVSSSCPSRDYSVVSSVVVSPVVITVPPRYHSPSFS